MDELTLYQRIASAIKKDILDGEIKPGDRLPSVREMAEQWQCTVGTVQRAYRDLAQQGLVSSRAGLGTRVIDIPDLAENEVFRKAHLVHRAEAFLLEVLTVGYSPREVEYAMRLAMDRWRILENEPPEVEPNKLRFAGSHDLALTWFAAQFQDIAKPYVLQLGFTGSLGGLLALAEGEADLAGCHLWDAESKTYNVPFVKKIFPGRRMLLVALANRWLGWIVRPGNPLDISGQADLVKPNVKFVNRKPGSGTRVRLDSALYEMDVDPNKIAGFGDERSTHSEIARAVAEGEADVGFGLGAAAKVFNLEFIPFVEERYDLVIPGDQISKPGIDVLLELLTQEEFKRFIDSMEGYAAKSTGTQRWVE